MRALATMFVFVWSQAALAQSALPDRVTFPSLDGHTELVGYVYAPSAGSGGSTATKSAPAVVMMHGRAGAYSSLANGKYDATTISKRHQMWGELWAAQGYVAILVDGFGPRGYPHGFPRFSYDERPEALNEVTVRPLDAYGAINYLRTRNDVIARSDRSAGLVERRQRDISQHGGSGGRHARRGNAWAEDGISRRARLLSGVRTQGHVRRRLSSLCPGEGFAGRCRRRSVAEALRPIGCRKAALGAAISRLRFIRRHPRLRRSRSSPAENRGQSRRQGRCGAARAGLFCRATAEPIGEPY